MFIVYFSVALIYFFIAFHFSKKWLISIATALVALAMALVGIEFRIAPLFIIVIAGIILVALYLLIVEKIIKRK